MRPSTPMSESTENRAALVLGPLFLDLVMGPLDQLPEPGTELWTDGAAFAAGGAANQAVALARLDCPVQLRAYIGTDTAGKITEELLRDEGVDTSQLERTETQSITVSLSLGEDRAMVTRGSDSAPLLPPGSPPAALLADLRAIAKNRSVVEAWRNSPQPPLVLAEVGWDPSEAWDETILDHLDLVDYFLPNEAEAMAYTRTQTARDAAFSLQRRGPTIIVTRGAAGALMCTGGTVISIPAPAVSAVDPTGAGDTFTAALTQALLRGEPLPAAIAFANKAAAWSVQSLGGSSSAPSAAQLAAWVPE